MTPEDRDISEGRFDHLLTGDDWWEIRRNGGHGYLLVSLIRWKLKKLRDAGKPITRGAADTASRRWAGLMGAP